MQDCSARDEDDPLMKRGQTSACLNTLHITFTVWGCNLHSLWAFPASTACPPCSTDSQGHGQFEWTLDADLPT